jgi:Hint module/Glycine-rich domain-containing protein-like
MKQEATAPAPITRERISYLENDKGIDPTISGIDLELVKAKLQDVEDGLGWTVEQCDAAEVMYKRFLHLNKRFPNSMLVPSRMIDHVWHQHILDTRAYHRDTAKIFGGYFHHNPYLGQRNGMDDRDTLLAFEETHNVYLREFGEAMITGSPVYEKCSNCRPGECAKCAQSCFPAGTRVLQPGLKTKPIETIEVGDRVMCYDGSNLVEDTVEEIESPKRDHLYTLTFENDESLQLTDEHPIYTTLGLKSVSPISTEQENPELIVGTLKVGDRVKTRDGYQKLIKIRFTSGDVQTYNLKKLTNFSCYFVNGFLAHNKATLNGIVTSGVSREERTLMSV